ncbi:MAG TPA: nucleotidyltransferase domain-containing protein [Ktedonobacteraceae bacterium]|nr:nucleotidyltransferase domain-containing protein [Ktedonobacteraceae bacterium]
MLQQLVAQLKQVSGLRAIVLGGSYASGSARPDSDIDIGLYYFEQQPLDIAHIRSLVNSLNDTPDPVVTDLGGGGPWVNGGAWLTIQGQRVDFLYHNIGFVSATLDDCNKGIIRSDYWQQPAYGFHSYMYCAETQINQPLYDPDSILEQLKADHHHDIGR